MPGIFHQGTAGAISNAVASVDVRRNGRSIPAENVDLDTFLGEGQVDEITGTVTGQSAHPQLIEVGHQLSGADTELLGGLSGTDARICDEVGHEVEQPCQPRRQSIAHLFSPCPLPVIGLAAAARSFATTSARKSGGSSTNASNP